MRRHDTPTNPDGTFSVMPLAQLSSPPPSPLRSSDGSAPKRRPTQGVRTSAAKRAQELKEARSSDALAAFRIACLTGSALTLSLFAGLDPRYAMASVGIAAVPGVLHFALPFLRAYRGGR